MLIADYIIDAIESGVYKPLTGGVFVKRDEKSETLGGGIILNPVEVSYEIPDWCTVKCVPDKVFNRVGSRLVKCPLKKGDRVFVKPSDGNKPFDLHKNYQDIRFLDIIAIEKNGKVVPFLDRVFVKMIKREMKTAGGLWLPDNIEKIGMVEDTGEGEITGIGHSVAEDVRLGDYVYYTKYSSPRVIIDDVIYMAVREENLIGVKPSGS